MMIWVIIDTIAGIQELHLPNSGLFAHVRLERHRDRGTIHDGENIS